MKRFLAAAATGAVMLALLAPGSASANTTVQELQISATLNSSTGDNNSSLVITYDAPVTTSAALQDAADLGADTSTLTVVGGQATAKIHPNTLSTSKEAAYMTPPKPGSPDVVTERPSTDTTGPDGYAYIQCNNYYGWTDGNGRYTLQRACGSSSAPWGFKMSASLQRTVVGTVYEGPMTWTKNGVNRGAAGGQHPQATPYYQYHGAYNPAGPGSRVTYRDVLTWRHNIGPGGRATLTVFGSWRT